MTVDRATIAHLLRRAGFGPTPAEVDAAAAAGYEATVHALLDFSAPDPAPPPPAFTPYQPTGGMSAAQRKAVQDQRNQEMASLVEWWLNRMATTTHPLREKLTLFWHGHFATSYDKVQIPGFMYRQNQLFRTAGAGNFEALAQAIAKDPAMMIWLDTRDDKASHPNENFARELMELFTLGIGNFTETDVREAARAFTGWEVNPTTGAWSLQRRQHDSGTKTVLGHTGNLGGEDVMHIVATSAAGQAFIVSKVWSHFAYPVAPTDPVVRALVPGYARDLNIANLLRAVFLHPLFVSDTARLGLVKQPIEWVVGTLRVLGMSPGTLRVITALANLGQIPMRPPNVGGWPQNGYWLSTATSLARLQFATVVARDGQALAPHNPDAAAHLLSTTWSSTTASALAKARTPTELLTLALVAPEYVLA